MTDARAVDEVVDPIKAWAPSRNEFSRLSQAPKHQLADPALAARLRGATVDTLLEGSPAGPFTFREPTMFGALFESMVALDIRTYAQAAQASVGHFRTYGGDHEVDLIVERTDRRVLAIEVKLASAIGARDVKHLLWLKDQVGDDLLDMMIITTGAEAYRRQDGVAVVPAGLLGP